MKTNSIQSRTCGAILAASIFAVSFSANTFAQSAQSAMRITLDDAIRLAIQHNHTLLAARSTIQQSEAQETTANLRPNPTLNGDWEYLPIFSPGENFNRAWLRDNTEVDIGATYLFERGRKRQNRLQAAKDATAVTRSQVDDNERTLSFQVATLFTNAQFAESTLELAQMDLKSFGTTVDIGEQQFKAGAISENDYLKIKLQLLQFQTDLEQAQLAKVQSLSDLRQQLGYESVPDGYDVVADTFTYQPLTVDETSLQAKALQNRPDLRAAQQGVTAAKSQYALAKADGKVDVTAGGNYVHANDMSSATVLASVPLAIFDRNQGEIARTRYAITQAQEQQAAASGQVITDVSDAFEQWRSNDRVVGLYRSSYLDAAQKSRDISEFSYRHGATSLLDFLDAERTYRATELGYRQSLAAYLLALEQLREAVGTRVLP